MFIFLFALATLLAVSSGQGDMSNTCPDVGDRMMKCAKALGGNFHGFNMTSFNPQDMAGLQSLQAVSPESMCQQLDPMVKLVDCMYDVLETCIPAVAPYMPSKANVITLVKNVCKDLDSINMQCLNSISSSQAQLAQCIRYRMDRNSIQGKSQQEIVCVSYGLALHCAVTQVARCDRDTGKFLERNAKLFFPPTCSATTYWAPHIGGGAAGLKASFSVFSLLMVWLVYFLKY